jgi:hypothetical protein
MKNISLICAAICLWTLGAKASENRPGDVASYSATQLKDAEDSAELQVRLNELESIGVTTVFNPQLALNRKSWLGYKRKELFISADTETQTAICKSLNLGTPSIEDSISKNEIYYESFAVRAAKNGGFEIIPAKKRALLEINQDAFNKSEKKSSVMILKRLVCVK